MGCFNLLGSPIEYIFYLLSLMQAYRAYQLAKVLRGEWGNIKEAPLTHGKAQLAEQAAFYLGVPPAVLVHEFFHAIPIYVLGGKVVNCGYGFYWGYVQPDRFFDPSQEWFISLAGTLGSLLIGLLYWVVLRKHKSRTIRLFGLRAMRFQVYFSLLYYPIFTAFTFIGDWRTIYNFGATPLLSGGTAVIHATILLLYFWADRTGRFEMVTHESVEEEKRFGNLVQDITMNPQNTAAQIDYAIQLANGRSTNKAKNQLKKIAELNPDSGIILWLSTHLEIHQKPSIPAAAAQNMQKALELGLPSEYQSSAYLTLGRYTAQQRRFDEANEQFTKGLKGTAVPPHQQATLLYERAKIYRHQQQYHLAIQDIQTALKIAREIDHDAMVTTFENELKLLEQQSDKF